MILESIRPEGGKQMRSVHVASVAYKNNEGGRKIVPVFSRRPIETIEDLDGYVAGVQMIVLRDEEVLVVKEFRLGVGRIVYGFPAGMVEKGETYEEAAIRELQEECGIKAKVLTLAGSAYINPAECNMKLYTVVLEYEGECEPTKNVNEEMEVKWTRLDLNVWENVSLSLQMFLQGYTMAKGEKIKTPHIDERHYTKEDFDTIERRMLAQT